MAKIEELRQKLLERGSLTKEEVYEAIKGDRGAPASYYPPSWLVGLVLRENRKEEKGVIMAKENVKN